MINLRENRNLNSIADEYHEILNKFLTINKIYNILNKYSSFEFYRNLKDMFETYKSNLQAIILADFDQSYQFHEIFRMLFKREVFLYEFYLSIKDENELKKNSYYYFTLEMEEFYKKFLVNDYEEKKTKKNRGYELLTKLKIRTCPYCNRNYAFTINKNKRKTRPEFDHFYPKSEYPLLALSFYNLIPSCHTCNHLKREIKIGVNPYDRGFSKSTKFEIVDDRGMRINLSSLSTVSKFEIKLESTYMKEGLNIETFALNELYNEHKDYVQEIMDKTQAYNSHARKALIDSFQGAGNTPEQVYNFVWGRYLEDAEQENRPLSKLTKDVLDQFEIN